MPTVKLVMALYLKKLFMIGRKYVQSFMLSAKSAQYHGCAALLFIISFACNFVVSIRDINTQSYMFILKLAFKYLLIPKPSLSGGTMTV